MLALVTGASRGIGKACALELAEKGYDLMIQCASEKEKLLETAESIKTFGRKVFMFVSDFSESKNVQSFCAEAKTKAGIPDVIINCAGVCIPDQLQDISDEDWDRVLSVNLKAVFIVCREFSEEMIQRRSGSIVNIASIWGRTGAAVESSYCASKGGLVMFSKALAQELGPSGIRVNTISPGCIDTDMNAGYSAAERKALEERTPLMRFGTPKDIAKAAAFLASDDASFITGADLLVDGGFTI